MNLKNLQSQAKMEIEIIVITTMEAEEILEEEDMPTILDQLAKEEL